MSQLKNITTKLRLNYNFRCVGIHEVRDNHHVQAARYKTSKNRTNPLTYEQYYAPGTIAHIKSWNSWNTCTSPFFKFDVPRPVLTTFCSIIAYVYRYIRTLVFRPTILKYSAEFCFSYDTGRNTAQRNGRRRRIN